MLGSNLRAILLTDTLQNGRLVFWSSFFLLQASFMAKKNPILVFFAKPINNPYKNNLLSVDH